MWWRARADAHSQSRESTGSVRQAHACESRRASGGLVSRSDDPAERRHRDRLSSANHPCGVPGSQPAPDGAGVEPEPCTRVLEREGPLALFRFEPGGGFAEQLAARGVAGGREALVVGHRSLEDRQDQSLLRLEVGAQGGRTEELGGREDVGLDDQAGTARVSARCGGNTHHGPDRSGYSESVQYQFEYLTQVSPPAMSERQGGRLSTALTKTRKTAPRGLLTGMLSIGALSRASGVPIITLRTWERRYGYPRPERTGSGHRAYVPASVPRLRRIADALEQGHRAGQVVGASDAELAQLLGCCAAPLAGGGSSRPPADASIDSFLPLARAFDARTLVSRLRTDWHRLGPVRFVRDVVAPLLAGIGHAWERGDLDIHHEHFVSEKIGDLLRELRTPLEEHARGPLVLLATLPGERHALGLHMTALLMASTGWRVCFLGPEVPIPLFDQMARDLDARAVGIGLSASAAAKQRRTWIQQLRSALPKRVVVLVGGIGAVSGIHGTVVVRHPDELVTWAARHGGR